MKQLIRIEGNLLLVPKELWCDAAGKERRKVAKALLCGTERSWRDHPAPDPA